MKNHLSVWTLTLRALASLVLALAFAAPGAATPVTITYSDSGSYFDAPGLAGHLPANQNYVVGDAALSFRNFFIFDLSSLAGQTITSASLALFNPADGYSGDATETYTLFEVTSDPTLVAAGGVGVPGVDAIFNDLGGGTSFGSRVVSAADNNSIVVTSLNAAGLSALNASLGQLFAIGGDITTQGSPGEESLFGFTGDPSNIRELRLEVEPAVVNPVPEPATLALLGFGLAGVAAGRYRRRRNQ